MVREWVGLGSGWGWGGVGWVGIPGLEGGGLGAASTT